MNIEEKKKRSMDAFVDLIGRAMKSLAERHEGMGHEWPDSQFVNELAEQANNGRLPVVVVEGENLGKDKGTILGTTTVIYRNGLPTSEFIKEPSNLFNEDGTIRKSMAPVLVHEYCHALQNMSMKNLTAEQRAQVPVATIEHANQALAISVWEEIKKIMRPEEAAAAEREWYAKKSKSWRGQHKEAVNWVPEAETETMAFQDKVSRYPGDIFIRQNKEWFEDKGRISVQIKSDSMPMKELARQWAAAKDSVDVPDEMDGLVRGMLLKKAVRKRSPVKDFMRYIGGGNGKRSPLKDFMGYVGTGSQSQIKDMAGYMRERGIVSGELLGEFTPEPRKDALTRFVMGELKHRREIGRLDEMRERLDRGQMDIRDLNALHDFAVKKGFGEHIEWARKTQGEGTKEYAHTLIDFAKVHKIGELERGRMSVERAAGVLGTRLKILHNTGYFPEDHIKEIYEREKYLHTPERERMLEGIREKARLRGISKEISERKTKRDRESKEKTKKGGGLRGIGGRRGRSQSRTRRSGTRGPIPK
ncbi:hypothetical protein ACFLQ2_04405 [archaeon]